MKRKEKSIKSASLFADFRYSHFCSVFTLCAFKLCYLFCLLGNWQGSVAWSDSQSSVRVDAVRFGLVLSVFRADYKHVYPYLSDTITSTSTSSSY